MGSRNSQREHAGKLHRTSRINRIRPIVLPQPQPIRPYKNGHDLFISSRVASASTSGKCLNAYIGLHLTSFESISKENLGNEVYIDTGAEDGRESYRFLMRYLFY